MDPPPSADEDDDVQIIEPENTETNYRDLEMELDREVKKTSRFFHVDAHDLGAYAQLTN